MKKVFAIGCGAAIVLAVVAVGGGWWWLQAHKDELMEKGSSAMHEGDEYGKGKDGNACVDEAVRRLSTTKGILNEATNKVFLESCLRTVTIPAGFCDGIPPRDEIMKSATWALSFCQTRSSTAELHQQCTRLVGAIQERCLAK